MIYFVLTGLLLVLSLLCIVPAPTNFLWKLSIGFMEWGHYFALFCVILVIVLFRKNLYFQASIGLVAMFLFLSPVIRSYFISGTLPDGSKLKGLSLKVLFAGYSTPKQSAQVFTYGQDKERQSLAFYKTAKPNRPCIIMVHGGGWDSGDYNQLGELNYYLVDKGYNIAAINYRLSPEVHFEEQLNDLIQAKNFVKEHAVELEIDSTELFWAGRSAGGQLVLMAANRDNDKNVKGVIAFYPPADVLWGYSVPGNPLIMDSRKVLDNFIGATAFEKPDLYIKASANYHLNPNLPPHLLIHGQSDVMVAYEHTRKMNAGLKQYKVPHWTLTLPWATHGFDFAFNGPASQLSNQYILTFLNHFSTK